jgi:hypothetical protein
LEGEVHRGRKLVLAGSLKTSPVDELVLENESLKKLIGELMIANSALKKAILEVGGKRN